MDYTGKFGLLRGGCMGEITVSCPNKVKANVHRNEG